VHQDGRFGMTAMFSNLASIEFTVEDIFKLGEVSVIRDESGNVAELQWRDFRKDETRLTSGLFLTAFINQKLKEELHLGQYYSVEQIARAVLRLGLDVQDQYLIDEENKLKRLRGERVLGRLKGLDSTTIKEAKVFFYEADQVLNHYCDRSILTDARGKALPH
jgi:hypothetical protein